MYGSDTSTFRVGQVIVNGPLTTRGQVWVTELPPTVDTVMVIVDDIVLFMVPVNTPVDGCRARPGTDDPYLKLNAFATVLVYDVPIADENEAFAAREPRALGQVTVRAGLIVSVQVVAVL